MTARTGIAAVLFLTLAGIFYVTTSLEPSRELKLQKGPTQVYTPTFKHKNVTESASVAATEKASTK